MRRILANKYVEIPIHYILSIIVIFFLGTLPQLFIGMKLDVTNYFNTIVSTFSRFFDNSSFTYSHYNKDLFPQIFIQYKETVFIFSISFLVSIIASFLIVYLILKTSSKTKERVKMVFEFLESIPDILLIIGLQLLIVWIYKKTNLLIMNIARVGDESIVFLPVLCLSLPTILMFTKLLLFRFEMELQKDYVLLARAKGFDKLYILNRHILRNVLLSMLYFSKTNIWFMLSNLYIIEYLFNIPGIFLFLKEYPNPEIFTLALILIYTPIFITFKLFDIFIPNELKGDT
ncbi:ABC transporter permease subunit [Bacillus wiedmannii]|uniref:ABC transporter permease subunit n=1 Tax=Bacillus wiedmannii TaxID=1890302 RepID=UPI000BF2ABEA|nr:ABC transporter permease subunit [Bacillus wiedmannii]MBG9855685.1 peptide ABC transporter permease [Bacillus wiedmannii]MEE3945041.1 ABC transporter permease subunit [Bacillus wiedmannii]PFZ95802.1 peptide ABC transporter permease [Bacillus wiedmannii]